MTSIEQPTTPPDPAEAARQLMAAGRVAEAAAAFRRLVEGGPGVAGHHNNLGVALTRLGRLDEAIGCFERALQLAPDGLDARRNLALAWSQRGRLVEAEAAFREVLRREPEAARAHHELANALRAARKLDESLIHYREAIRIEGGLALAHHDMGLALAELGRKAEARAAYQQALEHKPDFPEAYNNLGVLLEEEGRYDEAVTAYQESIRLRPNAADAHNNLGVALAAQRKYEVAVVSYRRALALEAHSPLALNNLGNALRAIGQVDEAVSSLHQAIRLRPDYAEAYNNLAIALVQQGRDEIALDYYERALYLRPDYPEGHLNRALAWLAAGDFPRGWLEYEWRWKGKDTQPRQFRQRRWDGCALEGRTILLHCEQGLGDTLQFVRYGKLLKRQGATVVLEAQKPLLRLLAHCPAIDHVVAAGEPLPDFDLHAPLLSLPGMLDTTLDTVPCGVPYLGADEGLIDQWCPRLKAVRGFKVGIAWQGNAQYRGDRQRSIPLAQFAPLARVPGVTLISLQKGQGTEQIENCGFPIADCGPIDEEAGPFMDTAAIMKNLDLVITSDTAIPHLAGGLGVPAWVALPFAADWRWLRRGATCPWYPTLRLFRQTRFGDWGDVFARLAEALAHFVGQNSFCQEMVGQNSFRQETVGRNSFRQETATDCVSRQNEFCPTPPDADQLYQQAIGWIERGDVRRAIDALDEVLRLRPNWPEPRNSLGIARHRLGELDAAEAAYREALRLRPSFAEAHNNLGVTLADAHRVDEAIAAFRRSLALSADRPHTHRNLASLLLMKGEFAEGWREFEWCWKGPDAAGRGLTQPRWDGSDLNGRAILLRAEQGLGDGLAPPSRSAAATDLAARRTKHDTPYSCWTIWAIDFSAARFPKSTNFLFRAFGLS